MSLNGFTSGLLGAIITLFILFELHVYDNRNAHSWKHTHEAPAMTQQEHVTKLTNNWLLMPDMDLFILALWQVESSGRINPPDGDGGLSIGTLQISEAYWIDSGLDGSWQDCRRHDYATDTAFAYWERWCYDALLAGDFETLARIHNGGPDGATKDSTLGHWQKVKEVMHE